MPSGLKSLFSGMSKTAATQQIATVSAAPKLPFSKDFIDQASHPAPYAHDWAKLSNLLREASKGKGNFNIGSASKEQADVAGKAWAGDNFKISSNNKAWISADEIRQYRPPTYKIKQGKIQVNFQKKLDDCQTKKWQSNGHLDIQE